MKHQVYKHQRFNPTISNPPSFHLVFWTADMNFKIQRHNNTHLLFRVCSYYMCSCGVSRELLCFSNRFVSSIKLLCFGAFFGKSHVFIFVLAARL